MYSSSNHFSSEEGGSSTLRPLLDPCFVSIQLAEQWSSIEVLFGAFWSARDKDKTWRWMTRIHGQPPLGQLLQQQFHLAFHLLNSYKTEQINDHNWKALQLSLINNIA